MASSSSQNILVMLENPALCPKKPVFQKGDLYPNYQFSSQGGQPQFILKPLTEEKAFELNALAPLVQQKLSQGAANFYNAERTAQSELARVVGKENVSSASQLFPNPHAVSKSRAAMFARSASPVERALDDLKKAFPGLSPAEIQRKIGEMLAHNPKKLSNGL